MPVRGWSGRRWLRRGGALAVCLAFASAGSALLTACAGAGRSGGATAPAGHAWYVSRNGNNANGATWATAWNELDNIMWSEIEPGDTIVIDGGSTRCPSNYGFTGPRPGVGCGMEYDTPLTVGASGTAAAPIVVRLATDAAHDGTAVFFGGRSSPLPYCDQTSYAQVGTSARYGIGLPGQSHVTIDGVHRSGIMVYGASKGVNLLADATSFITLRNLEIFDNGVAEQWAHGWRTDNPGIALTGHDIVIDRDLIHDNGQDEIQDAVTVVGSDRDHAPLHDISITNSWLYGRRDHPFFAGYGFSSGSQDVSSQDCTHVDGLQVFGGGLHQHGLTVTGDVFGPLLGQGLFPGDADLSSFDRVTITNDLFINALSHSIDGDRISSDPATPGDWTIKNITSYLTRRPAPGTVHHGAVDLSGARHSVSSSIFYDGYFATATAFTSASGNVYYGGDAVPGGVHQDPRFVGPLPPGNAPGYAALTAMDLTPRCAACVGVGSSLHDPVDLLAAIDAADGG